MQIYTCAYVYIYKYICKYLCYIHIYNLSIYKTGVIVWSSLYPTILTLRKSWILSVFHKNMDTSGKCEHESGHKETFEFAGLHSKLTPGGLHREDSHLGFLDVRWKCLETCGSCEALGSSRNTSCNDVRGAWSEPILLWIWTWYYDSHISPFPNAQLKSQPPKK